MEVRVGIGYDIHRLTEGKRLIIGGVHIPYEKGFDAHSDGDILFHSLTDALLGAVGYSDIGELFPDTDKSYKDMESHIFLEKAKSIVDQMGYGIANIDSVIIIQKPKIAQYRTKIIENTAKVLKIESSKIFVKAKTNEGLDSIGSGLSASCYSVVLLYRKE